jgi:hypothetical protein
MVGHYLCGGVSRGLLAGDYVLMGNYFGGDANNGSQGMTAIATHSSASSQCGAI